MKSEFMGIAIGPTQIVAIQMEKMKAGVSVTDSIIVERQNSLFEDCKHLIKTYSLEGKTMGITALGEKQDKIMILQRLSRIEVSEMLRWTVPEFVTWPEDSYYYDFVLADMPSDAIDTENQELLYVVALKKEHITELATGVLKGGGNLKIIDCAPAPLTYRFVEKSGAVIGIVYQESVEFTAWYNGLCLTNHKVPNDLSVIIATLEDIETELFSYGLLGIAGVYIYGDVSCIANNLQWESIYGRYGRLTPIPFEENTAHNTCGKEQIKDTSNPLLWDMALGLAYRGVMRNK